MKPSALLVFSRGLLTAAALCVAALGCQNAAQPTAETGTSASGNAERALAPGYKLYGAPLVANLTPTPLTELLAKPKEFEGKTVHIDAKVRRACSRKGCWMELAEGSNDKPATARVTFKDYGFFVPTDSEGAEAQLQGVVELKKVTADHVQHLEQEGATFAEKHADGSASELALVATGVALKK